MSLITNHTWAVSFRYRDFRLLWASTLAQSVGMGMDSVALGWLVLEMTESSLMVGAAISARMAAFFFLGVVSGAIADRMDRRVMVRLVTLSGGVVGGAMALVLLTGVAQVWHVIALTFAFGAAAAFNLTVRHAYTYDLVGRDHALSGLSLATIGQMVGNVIGALAAGAIIAAFGVWEQYAAVACLNLLAFLVLLPIRDAGQAAPTRRDPVLQSLLGYVQLVRDNRTLAALMLLASMTEIFGFTHQTALPAFARDVLGVGAVGLGLMMAFRGGGGLVGAVVLAGVGGYRRKGRLVFLIAGLFGLGQMAFSLTANLYVFLLIIAFINACAFSVDVLYRTLMQDSVPNEQRGRAAGSWVLSIGTAPVGHLGVGAMTNALGAAGALLVNGSVLGVISIMSAIAMRRVRRLD